MKQLARLAIALVAGIVLLSVPGTAGASMSVLGGPWQWVEPRPQGEKLRDAAFVTDSLGWAVGMDGAVLRTNDGGATWTSQVTPTGVELATVCFVTADSGWAAGYEWSSDRSVVVRTQDGGAHWTVAARVQGVHVFDVSFGSATNGVLVGDYGMIYRSADGGATWAKVSTDVSGPLMGVSMTDALKGWAVGRFYWSAEAPALLRTTDGGQTWTSQSPGFVNGYLTGVDAIDADTAVVTGLNATTTRTGVVLQTANGGATWNDLHAIDDPLADSVETRCPTFVDSLHGWVLSSRLLHTENAGATWVDQGAAADGLAATDQTHVWRIAGYRVQRSADAGSTWAGDEAGPAPGSMTTLDFVTATEGWAATGDGDVLHSTDGGETWAPLSSSGISVADLDIVDAQHGWAVGGSSDKPILHTSDGGVTWAPQVNGYTPGYVYLNAVCATDAQHAWAVGHGSMGYPLILHTVDGGAWWLSQQAPSAAQQADMYDVQFVSPTRGWIAGGLGRLASTTDGGATWTWVVPLIWTDKAYRAMAWPDATHGWAVGDWSTIAHTTDGGKTWKQQDLGPFVVNLTSVSFVDAQHGWAAGNVASGTGGGAVFTTSNGGATWRLQGLPLMERLLPGSVRALSGTDVIAAGALYDGDTRYGAILATHSGGVSPSDSTPPTVTVKKPASGWSNRTFTVRLSASDPSGVKALYTNLAGGGVGTMDSWTIRPGEWDEGPYPIKYEAVDVYGNATAPKTVVVGLDTTKPSKTLPLNHPSVARGAATTFKYRITDAVPGCRKAKATLLILNSTGKKLIKMKNLGTVAENKALSAKVKVGLGSGRYWWGVGAVDIAGNIVAARNIWFWTYTVR